MKAKPTVGFPFFGAFPSGRIPKTTKDVNVYFFIHTSAEIVQIRQHIPGTFFSYYYCGDMPVIMYEMLFES
jgi:hypothetical protein